MGIQPATTNRRQFAYALGFFGGVKVCPRSHLASYLAKARTRADPVEIRQIQLYSGLVNPNGTESLAGVSS